MTEVLDEHTEIDAGTGNPPGEEGPHVGAPLDRFMTEVAAFVGSTDADLAEAIHEKVDSPLRDAVLAARQECSAALDCYRDAGGNCEFRGDAWRQIVDYRASVEKGVVSPLSRILRDCQPGATLSEVFQDTFLALAKRAESVPAAQDFPEAGAALNRRMGDGPIRLARKVLARGLHRSKPVPLRLLTRYHLEVRLARVISKKRDAAQKELARCLVALETATSTWTHATLDLEQSLDEFAGSAGAPRREPVETENQEGADAASEMPGVDEIRDSVLRVGNALIDSLAKAAQILDRVYDRLDRSELDRLHSFLHYDIRAIGTFLLRYRDRRMPDPEWRPSALAAEADGVWIRYQEESRNRIRLNRHLLRTRATLIAALSQILDQVRSATVVPLTDVCTKLVDGVQNEAAKIKGLFDEQPPGSDPKVLADRLLELGERASGASEAISNELGGINAADAALRDLGHGEWERSKRDVDQLPSKSVIHAIASNDDPRPVLHAPRSTVNMRQIVDEVLSIRFAEQLKKPAKQLRRVVARRWGDMLMVSDTVSFNARAAAEKLNDDTSPESLDQARQVITDGLNRALERLQDASRALEEPWGNFNDAAVKVVMNVWQLIHRRVRSAESEADQWGDIGSRLSIASQSYRLKIARSWHTVIAQLRVWWRLIRMKGSALIRKGQFAVGVSTSKPAQISATIDAIRNFEQVDERMPFIYRRLFTLDALEEPTFLEGRALDVQAVRSHFERWKSRHQTSVLIVSSKLGNGRTSFLNTLQELVFEEARVYSVHFDHRCRSEREAVEAIAAALGIQLLEDAGFQELQQAISTQISRTPPVVCRFYELEHLVLAVPGGAQLISDLLVFLSSTDEYVYWIGGVSELCRQFLERTSITSGLALFHDLSPLSPAELEALILNRHRRSGVEVTFKPPDNMSALMRQRLSRTESADDRQEILSEVFFDNLSRFAQQDLRLALFGWLQSVEFDDRGDSVSVNWSLSLDFGYLSSFDRQRAFSLRSFLFHKTLTVDEHAEIFRMSTAQSILILESLLNTGLLTPNDRVADTPTRIEMGERYRIHPLMQGPVRQQLVGRHMVY